ncbi:MAG TPA: ATP-binding protein [Thermoanaerobaculia bacterium]|nr:ATP-binding protein [Thermoanaerobaculia bacterium]
MRLLRNIPIARKLTIIIMLTSSLALLLTCIVFVTYELVVFRSETANDLVVTARIMGDSTSAALSFNDPSSAEQTLRALNADPHIVDAAVYDRSGKLFATYRRAGFKAAWKAPAVQPQGHRFTGDSLQLFHRIELAGESAGTVYLESDLEEMRARLWRYGIIAALVILAASLVSFLLSTKLQAAISGPISQLASVVGIVATQQIYSVRAPKQGEDELGRLIDGFNEMLDQIEARDSALEEARDHLEKRVGERTAELQLEIVERKHAEAELESIHKQLLEASRRGGMAEIATNVLHNVGNVLTSVNVSATLVAENVKKSGLGSLTKVVALLRDHADDLGVFISEDPRGKLLPDYLSQLAEHLLADQEATLHELESLRSNIEHIKEIVAMQQNYARVSGVKELVHMTDLVEDSLRINLGALNRHGVEIVRELGPVPPINVDKHKVLQILVNLVRNAKYACDESGRADKRLTMRVGSEGGRIRITVIDNGVGIPPENLARIFNHGFTTRKDGHGFGLHSGALAAQEMGGSLSVESGGMGRGATFTLELPLEEIAKGEAA